VQVLGALLGNYRVMELLGEGGMGVVYVGRHEKLGQRVVVKVLRPEMSSKAEVVQRFFNEALAVTAIQNPGIAQVFDVGTTPDGQAYFVMELLKGETLTARLGGRRLEPEECCRIARQVANVLQTAHAAGITHRDLKPDNLFLVPDVEVAGGERVKVLDFGIAKLTGEVCGFAVNTSMGMAMGTPSYMSPEQCRDARAADARSDIYSLGCVLFKMVCGRAPFAGKNAPDVISAHVRMPPPDPRSLAPDVPPALAVLILRMLAKEPGARPQTMAAVSQSLDEIQRALAAAPARAPTPPPLPLPLPLPLPPPLPPPPSPTLPARPSANRANQATMVPGPSASASTLERAPGEQDEQPTTLPERPPFAAARTSRAAGGEATTSRVPRAPAADDQTTTSRVPRLPAVSDLATTSPVPRPPAADDRARRPSPSPPAVASVPLSSAASPSPSPSPAVASPSPPAPAPTSSASSVTPPALRPPQGPPGSTIGDASGRIGVSTRRRAAGLPVVLGGLVAAGALAATVIVLATGGRGRVRGQITYDEIAASARTATATVTASASARPTVVSIEEAMPAPSLVPAPATAAAPAAASEVLAECQGLQAARRWAELERCADRLKAFDDRRAAELRGLAVEEARAAPRIAAVDAALQRKHLRRAWAELAQVWTASVEYAGVRRRYELAEARAIDELAAELERVKGGDCEAYRRVLAEEQASAPPRVAAEAGRRIPCVPQGCNAEALADEGQARYVVSQLAESLASYEAAYACKPDARWAEKALIIACNLGDLAKAKIHWAQLPSLHRPRVLGICERNQITADALDAP